MGKKMNKMYEKDTGGQASNKFLILKNKMSLSCTDNGKFLGNTRPPHFSDHELICVCVCVCVHVYAEQLKLKTEDQTNQCLQNHNKFLSIYLFIFSLATQEATANLQGAVVARG